MNHYLYPAKEVHTPENPGYCPVFLFLLHAIMKFKLTENPSASSGYAFFLSVGF